jgi:hypothetical protein
VRGGTERAQLRRGEIERLAPACDEHHATSPLGERDAERSTEPPAAARHQYILALQHGRVLHDSS